MTGYKALYAVPKQSFDTFLKYRMGTFPNLKSLSVDQLNFNEAKKLQAVHQTSSNEKQKPLSLRHDNPLTQGQINFYQDELPTAANNYKQYVRNRHYTPNFAHQNPPKEEPNTQNVDPNTPPYNNSNTQNVDPNLPPYNNNIFPDDSDQVDPSRENESFSNATLRPDGPSQSTPNNSQAQFERRSLDNLFEISEAEHLREQLSSPPTVIKKRNSDISVKKSSTLPHKQIKKQISSSSMLSPSRAIDDTRRNFNDFASKNFIQRNIANATKSRTNVNESMHKGNQSGYKKKNSPDKKIASSSY